MTKADYVIARGDLGIWDGSKRKCHWLDWLNDKPFTTKGFVHLPRKVLIRNL